MAIRVLPDDCPGCGRAKDSKARFCGSCTAKLRPPTIYNGSGEAEVVLGEQLSSVLNEFREQWYKERPRDTFRPDKSSIFMGPVDFLVHHSGCSYRKIHGIMKGEYRTVSFSTAEKLLQAIDREYMLSNGTIRILPNPNWSLEKWVNYMKERGCI